MQLVELPEPIVKENDVLVQIQATSTNPLDAKIKSGEFKLILPYKFPLVLGHDVAGIITKVGSKVSRFKVGDEVFARPADSNIGAFAEYIARLWRQSLRAGLRANADLCLEQES